MSATPSQPRQRASRGRLLVVGASPAVRDFVTHTRRHLGAVSVAATVCDAIAEVAASTAREPITAVAISSECELFEASTVIEAFGRVDPAVPLLMLYPAGDDALSAIAIAEGFEDCVPLPCEQDELLRVLEDTFLLESAPTKSTPRKAAEFSGDRATDRSTDRSTDRAHESAAIPAPTKVVDIQIAKAMAHVHPEAPVPAAVRDERHAASAPPHATAPSKPTSPVSDRPRRPAFTMPPITRPAAHPVTEGPPNDLSLVRAVIDGDNLRTIALHALQHQIGTTDVRLVAEPRAGEEEAVARERVGLRQAPVVGKAGSFGVLLSATIEVATLHAWAAWLAEWIDLDESHRHLRRMAWSDELTGAGNRRALFELLPATLQKASHDRRHVSLMYLDIDNFKQYNDRFGHAAGDEVLRESVEVLRSCIRPGDHVFRMGGDEFVILFCDPNPPRNGGGSVPEDVEVIAERCRKAVRDLQLPLLGAHGPGPITMSAGFALYPWEATTGEHLLSLADQRALRAKLDGKDTIDFGCGPNGSGENHAAPPGGSL